MGFLKSSFKNPFFFDPPQQLKEIEMIDNLNINTIKMIAQKKVAQYALELYDLEWSYQQGKAILKVFVDKSGGVSIGDCEKLHHALNLDIETKIPEKGSYRLEVSSPGVERKLKTLKHFQKAVGSPIRIVTAKDSSQKNFFKGTLIAVSENCLSLDTGKGQQTIKLLNIKKAHIKYNPPHTKES